MRISYTDEIHIIPDPDTNITIFKIVFKHHKLNNKSSFLMLTKFEIFPIPDFKKIPNFTFGFPVSPVKSFPSPSRPYPSS